jgi:hypothetical protein
MNAKARADLVTIPMTWPSGCVPWVGQTVPHGQGLVPVA